MINRLFICRVVKPDIYNNSSNIIIIYYSSVIGTTYSKIGSTIALKYYKFRHHRQSFLETFHLHDFLHFFLNISKKFSCFTFKFVFNN